MSDERFTLDTNILVCALDRQSGQRHLLAGTIIDQARRANCWLTLQAISEFYAVVTRKRFASVAGARDQALDWLSMFPTASTSATGVRAALMMAASGQAPIGTRC
jgi:predicted nucleic acid-binding protein